MGHPPGVETPVTPDEPGVLDGGVGVEGLVGCYAAAQNRFNLGRHLVRAEHYRNLREGAVGRWAEAVA
jgi:hypothetical protein